MKLTEENFEVESLIDDVISYDLKQQILENQEKLEKIKKELDKRIDEETKHINHPKQIYRTVQHNCEYNLTVCKNLKGILDEK